MLMPFVTHRICWCMCLLFLVNLLCYVPFSSLRQQNLSSSIAKALTDFILPTSVVKPAAEVVLPVGGNMSPSPSPPPVQQKKSSSSHRRKSSAQQPQGSSNNHRSHERITSSGVRAAGGPTKEEERTVRRQSRRETRELNNLNDQVHRTFEKHNSQHLDRQVDKGLNELDALGQLWKGI